MANRYMSNLRGNASPGYYDTISAIVAADSQARSAAIQGRYDAMSNSITVIADSMIKGMNSAANYQLEQEKLITARRIAESEMAAKATEMQIREQEAESQRLMSQARYDQMVRANRKADMDQKAAAFVAEYVKGAPAIGFKMSELDDFKGRDEQRETFNRGFDARLAEAEKTTPGIQAAFWSHESVTATGQQLFSIAERAGTATLTDPSTGQAIRQKDILAIFDDKDARPEQLMPAIRAGLSPSASPAMRARANTLAKTLETSRETNPTGWLAYLEYKAQSSNPSLYKRYRQDLDSGMDAGEAADALDLGMKTFEDRLRGTPQKPPDAAKALAAGAMPPAVQQEVESNWDIALRTAVRELPEGGTMALSPDEVRTASDIVRTMYQDRVKRLYNAKSPGELSDAVADMNSFLENPASAASVAGTTRILLDTREPAGDAGIIGGTPKEQARARQAVRAGGKGVIPAGATATSESVAALADTSRLGPVSRAMDGYAIDPAKRVLRPNADGSAGRPFKTVAELVLWEMENSPKGQFRSATQVISDLKKDGILVESKDARTAEMTRSFLRGFESKQGYGKNSVIASRLGATAQPRSDVVPAMVGATAGTKPAP